MKRLAILFGLLVLGWAGPVGADWLAGCKGMENHMCTAAAAPWACCTGPGTGTCPEDGQFTDKLGGTGKLACHHPDTGTDSPSPINVSDCDQVDIFWYPNWNGAGADSAGDVDVYTCPVTASANYDADGNGTLNVEADWLLMCQDLDGGTTLTALNTEAQGWGIVWLWFDVGASVAHTNDAELLVKCNVGPQ